jgi:hypothetical protein
MTSAEDRWTGAPLDWTRGTAGSAVAVAVAVEVFLPLAYREESWGWSATGAMIDD